MSSRLLSCLTFIATSSASRQVSTQRSLPRYPKLALKAIFRFGERVLQSPFGGLAGRGKGALIGAFTSISARHQSRVEPFHPELNLSR